MALPPARKLFPMVIIVAQLLMPVITWSQEANRPQNDHQIDAARYRATVSDPGTPYRDRDVEYPPGALVMFKALKADNVEGFVRRLIIWNALLQAAIAFMLLRAWGKRASLSYLALSLPIISIVYMRFDLAPVALAVLGSLLLARGRAATAGISWAVASFVKIWPLVLLPALLIRGKVREFALALAVGAVGLFAWVAWGGFGGPKQVLTYRGAKGWEMASIPGTLLRLVTRATPTFESGSWRVGSPPGALSLLVTVGLVAVVAYIWTTAARTSPAPGVAEVAAVTAPLVFGTLLSPQFIVWILPFVGIAAASGKLRIERWAAAVSILTCISWVSFDADNIELFRTEALQIVRNVVLVGLLVVAIMELRQVHEPAAVTTGA